RGRRPGSKRPGSGGRQGTGDGRSQGRRGWHPRGRTPARLATAGARGFGAGGGRGAQPVGRGPGRGRDAVGRRSRSALRRSGPRAGPTAGGEDEITEGESD